MRSDQTDRKANRLAQSTSPYLLQHAYNPVDWYEWGAEALDRAKREDKPILVSIGYSSCHWCHVMERECFENADIAALMNEHLVCIKVDREERPDIDHVYMEAVQAMGLQGGWPLNVFLTPDQQPFYGGTYFPPKNWSQLILQLSRTFRERRAKINESAEDLTQHLNANEVAKFTTDAGAFLPEDFHAVFGILESRFDPVYGGMDRAPKFVMPTLWLWLLRYHHQHHNPRALEMVLHTLRQLAAGGIYDQLGGGFSRYSVDGRWFAPHFEKMLYDNAQLISLYSEAYRISPEPRFREVVYETLSWLQREMKHPDGAYYSALDADSEGEEGRFYTWTDDELRNALGDQADLVRHYYQATRSGNWEHGRNILYRTGAPGVNLTPEQENKLQAARSALLTYRNQRTAPGLDDKILTGWNAMLITGMTDAFKSFDDEIFLDEALGIARFIDRNLRDGSRYFRSFKGRHSSTEGFLEDYAHLTFAYIGLYECTFDESWARKAEETCTFTIDQFRDPADGFFYFTPVSAEKLIARKKDLFDNVIPSPNSVMARALFRLGILLDREEWKQDAIEMATSLRKLIVQEPSYLSNWGILAMEITFPFFEIVVAGENASQLRRDLVKTYEPFCLVMGTSQTATLPLVIDKPSSSQTLIHVCVEKTCRMPVTSVAEALKMLSSLRTT